MRSGCWKKGSGLEGCCGAEEEGEGWMRKVPAGLGVQQRALAECISARPWATVLITNLGTGTISSSRVHGYSVYRFHKLACLPSVTQLIIIK